MLYYCEARGGEERGRGRRGRRAANPKIIIASTIKCQTQVIYLFKHIIVIT